MSAWTLLLLLTKVSLILAVALICTRRLSHSAAGSRHLLWTVALALALLTPLVALGPGIELPVLASTQAARPDRDELGSDIARSVQAALQDAPSEPRRSTAAPEISWSRVGMAAYGCGALLVFLPLAIGFVRASRLKRTAAALSDHPLWSEAHERLGALEGRDPEILVSDSIHAPVTFGFFRPTVLVPKDISSWTPEHLQSALIHELEHVSRRDWLSQMLGALACAAYWFHPLVWFGARRLHLEAERACDERVLHFGANPQDYAQQLVDLTRHHHRNPLQTAVAMASGSELADRVYSVLQSGRNPMNSRRKTTVLAAMIVILGLSSAAIVPTQATPTPHPDREESQGATFDPFLHAARQGDLRDLEDLLNAGQSVDIDAGGRTTALILAATYGHADAVDALIEAGADVNKRVRGDWRDGLSRSALGAAARGGHLNIVRSLVEAGADVDRNGRGDASALMEACQNEHVSIVSFLLEQRADVNRRIKGDGNAMIAAARGGNLKIMKMLVDAGGDVNAGVEGDGNALITAVRDGNRDMVVYLLEQGADPNKYVAGDETAVVAAAESGDHSMLRLLGAYSEDD